MKSRICLKVMFALLLGCSLPLAATTWYVRPDGGTRYSTQNRDGRCDGKADAAYPGKGVNRHCAFNDARFLWQDGSKTYGNGFPGWGWIGTGGDTYIIRGSIAEGVSYRVGWPNNSGACVGSVCSGVSGDQFHSGIPVPPPGTAEQHTRILGGNYGSCKSQSARTQLHGGWGVLNVLNLRGASYVDIACLDITDFSNCGRDKDTYGCESGGRVLSDFASQGITFNNKSTNVTLTDVRVHGMGSDGIFGAPGTGFVGRDLALIGNADSGWNADAGDKTSGEGSFLVQDYDISWNGCVEQYPIVDRLPYFSCRDDVHGGYGDGFGTASVASQAPGWQVRFDNGTVSYNTQDGLDALHVSGPGSSITISRTLAYGNEGQQFKAGDGAVATMEHNIIFGNCGALTQTIPGRPVPTDDQLGDTCRAGNTAVVLMAPPQVPAVYQYNTMYTNGVIGLEVEYQGKPDGTQTIKYDHNIFVGFPNSDGENPTPIYSNTDLKMFGNPGSSFSHNVTYHARSNWRCPATALHEVAGSCSDPHLKDESWHAYGFGDVSPVNGAGKDAPQPAGPSSSVTKPDPSSATSRTSLAVKSAGVAILVTGVWGGFRYVRNRGTRG
mgnify:FL=1